MFIFEPLCPLLAQFGGYKITQETEGVSTREGTDCVQNLNRVTVVGRGIACTVVIYQYDKRKGGKRMSINIRNIIDP